MVIRVSWALLERAARPPVFEVAGPRSPSEAGWAVLRAPFELPAQPGGGFLAEDGLTRFCVVRRLGPAGAGWVPAGAGVYGVVAAGAA